MKKMLPGVRELCVLGAVALLAALLYGLLGQQHTLPLFAFPMLLIAMLMGARRNGHLDADPAVSAQIEETEEVSL